MTEHQVIEVERVRSGSGMGTGLVIGLLVAVLAVAILSFFALGGPNRFSGRAGPSQTNVNAPAQPAAAGPQINIPRQVDVNINQPPAQGPAVQLPAVQLPAVQLPSVQAPAPQVPAIPAGTDL